MLLPAPFEQLLFAHSVATHSVPAPPHITAITLNLGASISLTVGGVITQCTGVVV